MASVDSTSMIYDAQDRMAEQTSGSSHTQIAYGPYGLKLALMNGQTLVNGFVKLPGGARAIYNSSGLAYFRHADHLGSSRLATTPSRTKYSDVAYAPYGEDYNDSPTTPDLAFTDQNQDTVAGGSSNNLYDFMFREYRTAHGRWTSPDPAGLGAVDPTNPQTWNRYAYVMNNPFGGVDPLGLCMPVTTYTGGGIVGQTITLSDGSTTWMSGGPFGMPCGPPPPGCAWLTTAGSGEGEEFAGQQCFGGAFPTTVGGPPGCAPSCNGGGGGGGGGNTNRNPAPQTKEQQCAAIQQNYNNAAMQNNAKWYARFWGSVGIGFASAGPGGALGSAGGALLYDESRSDYNNLTQDATKQWAEAGCQATLQPRFP